MGEILSTQVHITFFRSMVKNAITKGLPENGQHLGHICAIVSKFSKLENYNVVLFTVCTQTRNFIFTINFLYLHGKYLIQGKKDLLFALKLDDVISYKMYK